jgi:hypothetical protein
MPAKAANDLETRPIHSTYRFPATALAIHPADLPRMVAPRQSALQVAIFATNFEAPTKPNHSTGEYHGKDYKY